MADQCIVCLEDLVSSESLRLEEHVPGNHLAAVQPSTIKENSKDDTTPKVPQSPDEQHDDRVAILEGCGHTLHDVCLRSWTAKANSCPICRQAFHVVHVYDAIGGTLLSKYDVEDKQQVIDFDHQAWLDENPEPEEEVRPCPVCNLADREDVLLLCDGCDTPYHTHCIGLDSVPRGAWFCMECADALAPELHAARPEATLQRLQGRNDYFPRTQASMRRARRRARSDEWMGAWGQISGRIFEALNFDIDSHDEDDALEEYRRAQQLRDMERREYQRWQQRLNIADRLGARDVFARNIQNVVGQQLPSRRTDPTPRPVETRQERQAWGAFEAARQAGEPTVARRPKRKSRSITASPSEPTPAEERRLKRPRTRKMPLQGEAGPSTPVSASTPARNASAGPSRVQAEAPSFLSSLLREVEANPLSEDESIRNLFADSRSNGAGSPGPSPSGSAANSPRAMSATPPPQTHGRSASPALSLSSHIEPLYPPANYSPTQSNQKPEPRGHRHRHASHSDDESDSRQRPTAPVVGSPELKQPKPQRRHVIPIHSADHSPSRTPLPLETKEHISTIVRRALNPHWKSSELTADQYANINRKISHKLYEEVLDPTAVDEEAKKTWEKLASKEVAIALAELKA